MSGTWKFYVSSKCSGLSWITSSYLEFRCIPVLISVNFSSLWIRFCNLWLSWSFDLSIAEPDLTISLSTSTSFVFCLILILRSLIVACVNYRILTSACISFFFISAWLSVVRRSWLSFCSNASSLKRSCSSKAPIRLDVWEMFWDYSSISSSSSFLYPSICCISALICAASSSFWVYLSSYAETSSSILRILALYSLMAVSACSTASTCPVISFLASVS